MIPAQGQLAELNCKISPAWGPSSESGEAMVQHLRAKSAQPRDLPSRSGGWLVQLLPTRHPPSLASLYQAKLVGEVLLALTVCFLA